MVGFYLKSGLMIAVFSVGTHCANRQRKMTQLEADYCQAFHRVDQLIEVVNANPSKANVAAMNRAQKRVTEMVLHSSGQLPILCP